MAPILLDEIKRRYCLSGRFQAVFVSKVAVAKPIATCRYWQRPLNPEKLINAGILRLSRSITCKQALNLYELTCQETDLLLPKIKVLGKHHLVSAFSLFTQYSEKHDLTACFTLTEFEHMFMPRSEIVYTYVIENDKEVTDFVSFYCLPMILPNNGIEYVIRTAYSLYNIAATVPLDQLLKAIMSIATKNNIDAFTVTDAMENSAACLEKLCFSKVDGLHFITFSTTGSVLG
uniref:Glycylpeptide N-tetradecanoyltransferase n=1 Tax=Ditylenchus dipsaci TaxID=166011 RepID=A0A915E3T7_9BILA